MLRIFLIFSFLFFMACEKKEDNISNKTEKKQKDIAIELQNRISSVIEKTKNSIVTIISSKDDIKQLKFIKYVEDLTELSLGSGFVIEKDDKYLYILTNSHVIESSTNIKVYFDENLYKKAYLLGKDPKSDIAVLKVKIDESIKNIKPLRLGDANKIKAGYFVISAGTPYNLIDTYTFGIVSAVHRNIGLSPYEDYIQTDAPINPGNSGGPLLDINGNVIGITTASIQTGQGISFAIPINSVIEIYKELKTYGKVRRGWLGVLVQEIPEKTKSKLNIKNGVVVIKVFKNSPAKEAGIKAGDIILSIDNKKIISAQDLAFLIQKLKPDTKITVNILRNKQKKTLEITIKSPDMVK